MKIIILGAGPSRPERGRQPGVGAQRHHRHRHRRRARCATWRSRYDLRGVVGNGIEPHGAGRSGRHDTDLLIACAAQDEPTSCAARSRRRCSTSPRALRACARRSFASDGPRCWARGLCGGPHPSPEESLTRYIAQAHRLPGGHAGAQLRRRAGQPWCRCALAPARRRWACRSAALRPASPTWLCAWWPSTAASRTSPTASCACDGSTRIEPGDEVFVLAATSTHCRGAGCIYTAPGPALRARCAAS